MDASRLNPPASGSIPFRPVVREHWQQAIAAGLTTGDPAASGLEPVLKDATGGYFLCWPAAPVRSCIVYLGSEGQQFVAARTERELVSMLPFGGGLHDAMSHWSHALTDQGTPKPLPTERPSEPWSDAMVAALQAARVTLETDPGARIEAVNRAVLVAWRALCARNFKPVIVVRATRDYRPSERFTVGDRISHPTLGEGVVEADVIGKVTVAFASGKKTLVHGKSPS